MAVNYNTSIVRDGLVLYLDAQNNKSHTSNRFTSYGSGLVTENVGFYVNGDGTFQRVAAGTVIGGYTVKTNDVVYSYVLGATGCHYHGNDVFIPSGSYATFSFDYLVTGATTYPITDYLANFEIAFSNSIGTANNLQNVWQRRSFTSGPVGANGTLRALLYPGYCGGRLADSGTIYFRNPKVEWTNVDTGSDNFSSSNNLTTWTDLSGSGLNATAAAAYMDLSGTISGTPWSTSSTSILNTDYHSIFFMIKFNSSTSYPNGTTGNWDKLFSYNAGGSDRTPGVWRYPSSRIIHWRYDPGNSGIDFYSDSGSTEFALNTWYYIGVTKNSGSAIAYVNGVSVSSTGVSSPKTAGSASIIINEYFPNPLNNINCVQVYDRVLTASEVSQNFNALRRRFGI